MQGIGAGYAKRIVMQLCQLKEASFRRALKCQAGMPADHMGCSADLLVDCSGGAGLEMTLKLEKGDPQPDAELHAAYKKHGKA